MTARDIQRRLICERYVRGVCMPNWTPKGWFECDVIEITKAGFFTEYEIKLSRSDFAADQHKHSRHWVFNDDLQKYGYNSVNKHKAIAAKKGPSRFYFVCPEHLLEQSDLPVWAGLIWAHEWKNHKPPFNVQLSIQRPAPKLHKCKVDFRREIEATCYYRFMKLFLHGLR